MSDGVANRIAAAGAWISSLLGLRVMRLLARFQKRVSNPLMRLLAPRLQHMAVVEHRGRRSGKTYRTPVMAFIDADDFVVVLNYGTESDWVRNTQAADSAGVLHRGRRYRLTNPRIVPVDSPELPAALGAVHNSTRSTLRATLTGA
jgi:deazaflavin-dependent oxidoreductase (nitroreductase family)